MKVLFIGGTGIISSACSQLAVDRGIELYILNRGQTSKRPVPDGAKVLVGDIRRPQTVLDAIGDMTFDAIVDWVAYTPDQVEIVISENQSYSSLMLVYPTQSFKIS